MAEIKGTTTPIDVRDYNWGQIFSGTREALLRGRLVKSSRFPGDPGNNKISLQYLEGSETISVKKTSRNRFEVTRPYPSEQARRDGKIRIAESERLRNLENHAARARLPRLHYGYLTTLTAALIRRYPDISVSEVNVRPYGDEMQQTVTFKAPIQTLIASGLLTAEMAGQQPRWGELTRRAEPQGNACANGRLRTRWR